MSSNSHFPSIRIEGGLFGPDILDALAAADLPGQKPQDFGLAARRSLTDDIAAAFNDARTLWGVFQNRLARLPESDMATSLTRDSWVVPFLGLLGYELRYNPKAYEVDGLTFAISHRAGGGDNTAEPDAAPPVHVVGARQEMGRLAPSGRPRLSPHGLMQEYLNRSEALWGLVTNGLTLRVLRDSTYVRRQAYVEFDLEAIFSEDRFADFVILFRLLHRTRFPQEGAEPREALLEQYYTRSVEQGGRVREHLRDGVEACLVCLANGFLHHPGSADLRAWLQSGDNSLSFYRELLRLVYRFLFLLVSEERGLISDNPLYLEHYSIARLRRIAEQRAAYTEDDDLWQSLRVLWVVQTDEKLARLLGLSPLNGELFAKLNVDDAAITNRDLLDAFWRLAYYQESPTAPSRRVNYAALDTEELGSVYESLLEFHPHLDWVGSTPSFDLVAEGGERRSTGSHYTPPELVSPLIEYTLEPVIREKLESVRQLGGEKGRQAERTALEKALLSIRVLDPACGSGHFLLAASRRLGKELARVRTGEEEPAPERIHEAIRDITAHCIFGVDKNPLAIELCRVALWLESHAGGKPLTFLDHHIRCGDSLLGVADLSVLKDGIPDEAFKPVEGDDRTLASSLKRQNEAERDGQIGLFAWNLDGALEHLSGENLAVDAIPDDTPELVRKKRQQYQRRYADPDWLRQKEACDLWTAAFMQPIRPGQPVITSAAVRRRLEDKALSAQVLGQASALADENRFFHWALEFPEVFARGGFDAILGNPPFMGGLRISTAFGTRYRRWLEAAYKPFGGTADLCAAFFRRALNASRPGGRFGMIATNTIGQGDTRESGLAVILKQGGNIIFARRFVEWPGRANVEVNLISACKGKPQELSNLDGLTVGFISSRLDSEPEAEPQNLNKNEGKAFIGDFLRGLGFVLEPSEAEPLLRRNPNNADALFLFLTGEDLNSHPQQSPSRWVICFHDWTLYQAQEYPDLFSIVEKRVKPEREQLHNRDDHRDREHWWLFARYRSDMRPAIAPLQRVLVRSRVSELHMLSFMQKGIVYGDATVVFAFDDNYHFALLQSNIHEAWVRRNASTMRTDIRYTPTDCFETFPFPSIEYTSGGLISLLQIPTISEAEHLGNQYHENRRQVMLARQLGLTKTYNLFNNPACEDEDIQRLRELHAAMDNAVLACYGWEDLDLGHGFHQNDRGQVRYTVSPTARRELLRRLLALNLELAEAEKLAAGKAGKPAATSAGGKAGGGRKPASAALSSVESTGTPSRSASRRPVDRAQPDLLSFMNETASVAETPLEQPSLTKAQPEKAPAQQAVPTEQAASETPAAQPDQTGASDYSLYHCSLCSKRVFGFDRENHSREAHNGKKVDFSKI